MTDEKRAYLKREIENRIKNGVCQVLGAGISNLPLVCWLSEKGAKIIVRDMKTADKIDSADEIISLGCKLIAGGDYLDTLPLDCDEKTLIFRSPGMRPDIEQIIKAVERGAMLTSEMELFLLLTPAKVVAITGSDGKTTTTTLTGKMLSNVGRVFVGGNIGKPLLPEVENMTSDDFAVVELSSFQLQTMKMSCQTAAITNITENHLNWHHGMDEYTEAKFNAFRHGECQRLVLNADNEGTLAAGKLASELLPRPRLVFFSLDGNFPECADEKVYIKDDALTWSDGTLERKLLDISSIKLPGRHNVANYMTAIALCLPYLADIDGVKALASEFGGVEHRLELVRVHKEVKYYNSSIDSTPARTAAALSALNEKPIIICGGSDKGVDFVPLARTLCKRAKAVVLTGACRDKILSAFGGMTDKPGIYVEPDFTDAVEKAASLADNGDTVLLSPACASFDAFMNFEERGRTFKKIINSLT